KSFMFVENEYDALKQSHGRALRESKILRCYAIGHSLRPFVGLESDDRQSMLGAFAAFHRVWAEMSAGGEEPLMNILASFLHGQWRIIIFPRAKHRPS